MLDLVGDELNDVGIATEAHAYASENGPLCRRLDSRSRSIDLSGGGRGHDDRSPCRAESAALVAECR
jgi:hypothetical protein